MICENYGKKHDGSYGSGRFCGSVCARGFSTKEKRDEISRKTSDTLHLKCRKQYECVICGKKFFKKGKPRKTCSEQCLKKIKTLVGRKGSEACRKRYTKEEWSVIQRAAYRNGNNYVAGGVTRWFQYKNIKVQGTYELRVCKILDKLKNNKTIKEWEYTNDRYSYVGLDNSIHSYILDFKVFKNDNSFYYIEVKGYERPSDQLKWNAVRQLGYILEVWFLKHISSYEKLLGI